MLRRLARDTAAYTVASLLVRGQQILLIPIYTHFLGSGEYGIVETVAILGALANVTVALEVSQGMARYMAEADDPLARGRYAVTAIVFSIGSYGSFFLISSAYSAHIVAWLFQGQATASAFVFAMAAIALNGVFILTQDVLRWNLQARAYFLSGMIYVVVGASTGAWLVTVGGFGVGAVFVGQAAGAMAGFLAAVIGARNTLAGARFAPASLKSMLKFSMPLVLSSAAAIVSTFVDRVVVRESLGLHALGVYGVAARFASIVGILTVGLQAALSPLIYRLWRKADTAAKLHQVFRFYCAAMIPVLGGLSLFSPEIIFITSGQSFRDASLVLPPLAAASMLSSLYIFTPGLFLSGRTAIASSLNILGAVVNLGFCIILSRTVGIVGAALASAVAALVVFTGHALLGCRYFSVPFEKSHLAVCGAVLLLWVVCGIIISAQSFDGHPIFIAAKAAAILIASAGAWRYALSGYDRAALLNLLRRAKFN